MVVTDVASGSPADLAGLQSGDVIAEVNRQTVDNVEKFMAALTAAQDPTSLLLIVQRGNQQTFVVLQRLG